MNQWVPAYQGIFFGAKALMPTSARFLFLHLCMLASDHEGVVPIPDGVPLPQAIATMTGITAREAERSLRHLTEGRDPMLSVHADDVKGTWLSVESWSRWSLGGRSETPERQQERSSANAKRQAAYRERQKAAKAAKAGDAENTEEKQGLTRADGDPVTRHVTRNETLRNAPRIEEKRREQTRGDVTRYERNVTDERHRDADSPPVSRDEEVETANEPLPEWALTAMGDHGTFAADEHRKPELPKRPGPTSRPEAAQEKSPGVVRPTEPPESGSQRIAPRPTRDIGTRRFEASILHGAFAEALRASDGKKFVVDRDASFALDDAIDEHVPSGSVNDREAWVRKSVAAWHTWRTAEGADPRFRPRTVKCFVSWLNQGSPDPYDDPDDPYAHFVVANG